MAHPNRLAMVVIALLTSACAQVFPRPDTVAVIDAAPSAGAIFDRSFAAHGGGELDRFTDLNVALDGDWKFLITRIQPLVTDHRYRVASEERLLPGQGVYTALYTGPAGTKKVVRTADGVRVFYDGEESFDEDVLQSTALTADAFYLFSLGPLALAPYRDAFVRLEDGVDDRKRYYRLYAVLEPGFGFSARDELVLWIDPETDLAYRVHITLEGYETTQGAHVDVTYLGYDRHGAFLLPSRFFERVLGPIGIDAHAWETTGIDINRGVAFADIDGADYRGAAAAPAGGAPPP